MMDKDYGYIVRFHGRAYARYDKSTKKGTTEVVLFLLYSIDQPESPF